MRFFATLVVGIGQLALGVVAADGQLAYVMPLAPQHVWIAQLAGNDLWTWLLLASGIFCMLCLIWPRWAVAAMSCAAGVIGTWSLISILWGLSAVHPVSLAAPILGAVVATLAFILARAWASVGHEH